MRAAPVTPAIVRAGIDLCQTRSINFYDALILASAQTSVCSVMLGEEMNARGNFDGVRLVNPFA